MKEVPNLSYFESLPLPLPKHGWASSLIEYREVADASFEQA
jgi:hypothetical protein